MFPLWLPADIAVQAIAGSHRQACQRNARDGEITQAKLLGLLSDLRSSPKFLLHRLTGFSAGLSQGTNSYLLLSSTVAAKLTDERDQSPALCLPHAPLAAHRPRSHHPRECPSPKVITSGSIPGWISRKQLTLAKSCFVGKAVTLSRVPCPFSGRCCLGQS